MDVVFDSDLSDVSEVDLDQCGPIQPYMFEPTRNDQEENSESEDDDEFAQIDPDGDAEMGPDVASWCQCGNCRIMPTLRESKCCQTTNVVDGRLEGIHCITEHEVLRVKCLNPHVLEVAYYDHVIQEGPLEEHQRIHQLYRNIAYRRFTRWIYGLLGREVRKVIPSCAVIAKRTAFPSETGDYVGFRYPQ